MNTELTNYEQAVMLKEAGYNVPVNHFYKSGGEECMVYGHFDQDSRPFDFNLIDDVISRPSLHSASDFLRTKGLHVSVLVNTIHMKWRYNITALDGSLNNINGIWDDHDTALSEGITQALIILKEHAK